ncbi:WcbI family polysaccharide biosynthesis putative acetyltransferase [Methylobacterium sp. NEAU 140]|uniref:WcbI family polysaccharide biosynthesis putative acetyltransferase n=1 Tax=Methylobacterium sp. NEAU 140 TaxID=3064945 RepID=UPI002736B46A|nr:WcbI family polysaccharide biosynthesis putative acetyltransferase [Methylobacterium sp. NEAU 140]MDP4024539.1 WcbI family polysaccharide biosynthesis putative acetyltransferase [Methylobacterium sp. NEAU 140]
MTDAAADRIRARKNLVVVMNCQGQEVIRYLRSSRNISCQYNLTYISSIVLKDDESAKQAALATLSTAHVVIAQDVTSVAWLRNDAIAQVIPKHCRFFRFCFWRFYGFWPVSATRFHDQMWYVADEFGPSPDFRGYAQNSVPPEVIVRNFEEQVEKFAYIERFSEIKMLPFFLDNYRSNKIFTDEWHPTSFFFFVVARYILAELGLPVDVELLPDDGVDNFRHRLVLDAVTEELGLTYDQSLIQFHDTCLDRETLYDYFKFAEACYDRRIPWIYPRNSFHEWRYAKGREVREVDVTGFGRRVEAARPTRATAGPLRWLDALGGRRRAAADEASWVLDLRDFRRISALDIRLTGGARAEPVDLELRVSLDGRAWRDVATLRLVPDGSDPEAPVAAVFADPVFARHVRVDPPAGGGVRVAGAEVYTRALVQGIDA